jgi:hypothetical protein
MSMRWVVFSGGAQLGPWSATRIRDELRLGRIDPFDLVAIEGGQIKRPLLEVDEIFETAQVQPAALINDHDDDRKVSSSDVTPQSPQSAKDPLLKIVKDGQTWGEEAGKTASNPADDSQSLESQITARIADIGAAKRASPERPRVYEALASKEALNRPVAVSLPSAAAGGKHETPNIHTKRYVIWRSPQESLGPHSSREILNLWHKRQIPASASIQRLGNPKRIAIAQFVQFYEKNAPSRSTVLRQAMLVVKAKSAASRWLALAVVMAAIIVTTAFFFSTSLTLNGPLLDDTSSDPGIAVQTESTSPEAIPPEAASGGVQSSGPQTNKIIEKKPQNLMPTTSKKTNTRQAQVPRNRVKVYPTRRSNYQSSPNGGAGRVSISPLPPATSRGGVSTVPGPAVQATQSNSPAISGTKGSGSSSGFTDGATVTLQNYRFNAAQVSACEGKCKIPMTGPQGSVTAVFFKEAFGAAFAAKSGVATISGTVRKDPASGAVQLLVQDVK